LAVIVSCLICVAVFHTSPGLLLSCFDCLLQSFFFLFSRPIFLFHYSVFGLSRRFRPFPSAGFVLDWSSTLASAFLHTFFLPRPFFGHHVARLSTVPGFGFVCCPPDVCLSGFSFYTVSSHDFSFLRGVSPPHGAFSLQFAFEVLVNHRVLLVVSY